MTAAAAEYFEEPHEQPEPRRTKVTGAEIRASIAANRARRLAIAEAMKREAGVLAHAVHADKEDRSGVALLALGKITSPEGRKIIHLFTLAHECGHIFLHRPGRGYRLPAHIKEMEAESYAHQAMREYGMTVPSWLSKEARDYVAWWIAKDRAAGIPIDPRAEAYAAGTRSPYEPLRYVPRTWKLHRALEPGPAPIAEPVPAPAAITWRDEARQLLSFVGNSFLIGYCAAQFGLWCMWNVGLYDFKHKHVHDAQDLLLIATGAVVFTCLAVTLKSIWRNYPKRRH